MKQMDTILYWYLLMVMLPATILLIGKIMWDKVRQRKMDANGVTVLLLFSAQWLMFLTLDLRQEQEWTSIPILLVQFILIGYVFKRTWPILRRRFEGEDVL